jgi:hypothetical protein
MEVTVAALELLPKVEVCPFSIVCGEFWVLDCALADATHKRAIRLAIKDFIPYLQKLFVASQVWRPRK